MLPEAKTLVSGGSFSELDEAPLKTPVRRTSPELARIHDGKFPRLSPSGHLNFNELFLPCDSATDMLLRLFLHTFTADLLLSVHYGSEFANSGNISLNIFKFSKTLYVCLYGLVV